MARLARAIAAGYPHYVTQHGVRSLLIFRNDEDNEMQVNFMASKTKRFWIKILAWHLILENS